MQRMRHWLVLGSVWGDCLSPTLRVSHQHYSTLAVHLHSEKDFD